MTVTNNSGGLSEEDSGTERATPSRHAQRGGTRAAAHLVQRLLPLIRTPRSFRFATRRVGEPDTIAVPTRYGPVRCLIYWPPPDAPLATASSNGPPIDLHLHGGAFIVRNPRQEEYIAQYIASEVGAAVVLPDYATAPQVCYPVAEHQCFDIARWIHESAPTRGWDASRMSVSGASAGAKLAINVCQQAHRFDDITFRAAVLAFPVIDLTRADRTSVKRYPRISPPIQRLALDAYFVDPCRRHEPLASPVLDVDLAAVMPPSLILTGEFDTLGPEGDELADRLARSGVTVTHHRFLKTDHGFTKAQTDTAREAMKLISAHLLSHLI